MKIPNGMTILYWKEGIFGNNYFLVKATEASKYVGCVICKGSGNRVCEIYRNLTVMSCGGTVYAWHVNHCPNCRGKGFFKHEATIGRRITAKRV